MSVFRHPGRHRVAVLVRHGLLPIELGIPHRMLGWSWDERGEPLYEVVTCTATPGPVRTDADFTVDVEHGPEALAEADTVIVPASHELDEPFTEGRLGAPLARRAGPDPARHARRVDLHGRLRAGGGRTAERKACDDPLGRPASASSRFTRR